MKKLELKLKAKEGTYVRAYLGLDYAEGDESALVELANNDFEEEEVRQWPEDEEYIYSPYYFRDFVTPLSIESVTVDGKDITKQMGEDAIQLWLKDYFNDWPHEDEVPYADYATVLMEFTPEGEALIFSGEIELEDDEEFDPKQLQLVKLPEFTEDMYAFSTYGDTMPNDFVSYAPDVLLYKGKKVEVSNDILDGNFLEYYKGGANAGTVSLCELWQY